MSTVSTQRSGCLASGFTVIGAILGALLTAVAAVVRFLYRVLFQGFNFAQVRNKSGFVLFWVTAVAFFAVGSMMTAAARPAAPSGPTSTPVKVTVIVTRLAQVAAPTLAPTATDIPDTATPTSTATPSATATSTSTATSTMIPETATAAAQETAFALATQDKAVSQTAIAAAATATREQYAANVTATAKAVGATATRRSAQATQTRVAKAATTDYLAQFVDIDYRELRDYAMLHEGEKVCIRGRVFNIAGSDTLQMYFAGTYDAAYVEFDDPISGIYENNTIRVCGVVYGYYTFQNAMGADVSQPALYLAFIP